MVSDRRRGRAGPSSFTIAVTPVADIVADTVTTAEDSAVTFNPLSGANGAEADSFENAGAAITAITQPAVGAAVLNADGSITYTPPADYNGTVTLSYTVTSGGVSETATITIEVTSVNDAPVNTVPGAQTLGEDAGPVAIPGLSVADPDSSDATPQVLTTVLTIPAASGALAAAGGTYNAATGELTLSGTAAEINAALATLTYTPLADFNTGSSSFTVTMVSDDGVAAPAVSSFTIRSPRWPTSLPIR